jgi:Uma2 family endonuclease
MVQQLIAETVSAIIYPDCDGEPMSDNTEQFRWIVTIKENLEILFANNPEVFVAGDLLWYPVQGNNQIRQAPDVMVSFGRPKGRRGSYQQWLENNIPPQVAFEILSPGNRAGNMGQKLLFYQRYGIQEYYIYDPQNIELNGFTRSQDWLEPITEMKGWVSPLLGIRFELTTNDLEIYRPDGRKFLTSVELDRLREQERQRAEQEHQRAEQERQDKELAQTQAEQERQRAEQERQRAEQERQDKELAQTQAEQERQRAEQERQDKELAQTQAEQQRQRAEQQRQRAEQEHQRAEQERQEKELAQSQAEQQRQLTETAIAQLEQERQRYQVLLEQLRQSGIDPGSIPNL